MEMCDLSENIVKKFNHVLNILSEGSTNNLDCTKWLKIVHQHIRLLNRALKNCDTVGTRKKIHTSIGHLKRIKVLLKSKILHIGRGLGGGAKINRSHRVRWEDIISAFSNRIRSGVIVNLKHKDVLQFMKDSYFLFKNRISRILKSHPTIKVNTVFCGEFIKQNVDKEILEFKYMNTKNAIIDVSTDLSTWFQQNVTDEILNKLEEFQEKDSGWALNKIINLEVNINKLEMGNGGSSYISLPKNIAMKHACINVKNNDDACFAWAIVSAIHPANTHSDRLSSYPHYSSVLNLDNITFPITLQQVAKFEKQNNISVNVYALKLYRDNFTVTPARVTKTKLERHVNLLMIQNKYFNEKYNDEIHDDNDDDDDIKYHFCWIKDLSKLVSSQLSKYKGKLWICDICLNYFNNEKKFNLHSIDCSEINKCKVSFPKESKISFKNFNYKEPIPFVIYSDFEAILEPFADNCHHTHTSKYQKHIPFSVGYYFKCHYDDRLSYYRSCRSANCVEWFVTELENISKFIESKFQTIVPMEISEIQQHEFTISTHCHICEKPYTDGDKKVRDHCHFSGRYRGPAHESCNLNYKKKFMVPIVYHNLAYDSHFLIGNLAKMSNGGHINLLPINKEKYISFTKSIKDSPVKFRFIDSFRFMASSLDKLSSYLDTDQLKTLKKEFQNLSPEKFELLKRKGVFPYDYIDTWSKLDEPQLPTKEHFYNKLNDCNITDNEYEHAENVWNSFNCQNLGEYSDLYLKTDVLLLTDVFENFREQCLLTDKLDPVHLCTLAGYTWNAMLKYTKVELELISDIDILMFIERGIRGGVSQCSTRCAEANNKYMHNYDGSKRSSYLFYYDINNLYGWAMCQCLPYKNIKWVENFDNLDVSDISDDSEVGYILEVDLEYPEHLHDKHSDLPLCPSHFVPPGSKFKKLATTLHNKSRYVIHYRNLKQVLALGVILKKIHRVLQFDQAPWLKPYIDLNTQLRSQAKNEFEKNFFKLRNNAVFGKTMENVRKHRIVKLVNKWDGRYGAKNYISSPQFHSRAIFDNNLIAIELNKAEIIFNKPIYIGMAILDISKTCVYDFHYNFMMRKFNETQCKMLYTDTDSLIYQLYCEDAYEEVMKQNLSKFDTSDYPPNNRYNMPLVNKKVVGLMKDECNGQIMTHFIGLRSKMYTYKIEGKKDDVKKSKGVKSSVIKNSISFKDYKNCLINQKILYETQRTIQSKLHNIYSVEQTKIALSPFDDKRYLIGGSVNTLPWGHYSLINNM